MNDAPLHNQSHSDEPPSCDVPGQDNRTLVIPPRTRATERTVYEGNTVTDSTVALTVAIALTGLVVISTLLAWPERDMHTTNDITTRVAVAEPPPAPVTAQPYDGITLEAHAAVVYDIQAEKLLYAHNAEMVRPLASLTKLMTGLVAHENASMTDTVVIHPSAIETEGDSGLFANETWRLGDLLSFMLVSSSNDGADAIATAIGSMWDLEPNTIADYVSVERFVDTMNRRAGDIGLTHTAFSNPSGLDEASDTYGATGTAHDVARLMAYVWEHASETLVDTTTPGRSYVSEDGFVHTATNTNDYVGAYPGLLGSKTGYTDRAGGNLAVIYDAGLNHPIVIVVMGSSLEGRFRDVRALTDATNAYMTEGWYAYEVAGTTPAP